MKIDRLIGILSVLLREEKVTAPDLAKRFEVSRRTINRDVEDLCRAGIPITTSQGTGGGISIMEGYRMDKTILTSKDMQMIMTGLRSLDSVDGSHYYGQLMEKIKTGSSDYLNGSQSLLIDLSAWNKESISPKIELIQDAIELGRRISFSYFAPKGESERVIEPYYLIFKWSSWYVYGYCNLRQEFRMFKLGRMTNLTYGENFEKRMEVPAPELTKEKVSQPKIRMKAIFEPDMKWHLIEEYGAESFSETDDGKLLLEREFTDEEGLIAWILACREKVTVLEPQSLRDEIISITSKVADRYR